MKNIQVTWERFAEGVLLIGKQGENLTGNMRVDVSEPLSKHPGATFGLRVKNAAGETYPAAQVSEKDGWVTWTITKTDTACAGEGWVQLVMYGEGKEIAKTDVAHTLVLPSLKSDKETPPDPVGDWISRAEEVLGKLEDLSVLPPITTEDNGKVLTAQNGAWVPKTPSVGGTGDGLPPVTDADEGKVLTVQGGTWVAKEQTGSGSGGVDFKVDATLKLENGILSVNTTDLAEGTDPRPITAQGVYNEFAVINALLKTI